MLLLNSWILFGLIPIYFIYKRDINIQKQTKFLYLSLVFMFLAMARPAFTNSYEDQKFDSHDYIIALDASYSMQAKDLKPSRYILAKEAIKKLIKLHPKDRFTLFAFTSSTLLISPPTTDTDISMMALDALNPKYILTKSTNLKNLFKRVAKLSMKQKNLIIFSDGGDEQNIQEITNIARKNSIIPYIVATATQKGAALKKDGKYIKTANESIVVSKINPMLIDLANATDGKYYKLNSLDEIDTLSNDIQVKQTKKEKIKVQTYKDFFYIPLIIALILLLFSITKIGQRFFILLPLLLLYPNKSNADLLDFYHLHSAKTAYKEAKYQDAAFEFKKISPSTKSYFNIATAYYQAGKFKEAIKFYMQIKTKNRELKQKIFYNLGNCAVKIKQYDKAKKYYIYALNLGNENDALYNLTLIRKLKTKKDVSKMLAKNSTQSKKKKTLQKSSKKQNQKNSSKSSTNLSSSMQTNGAGVNKKNKQNLAVIKKEAKKKGDYKFTYKAYEKINKGYTDEKEPW